ncbi:hypothetical protein LPJ70_004378 [Coemansia sp. RSA 2708]|nr:hypothetical protein LPJ70_004378 [Coemansia sp. RSA 2708]KAJ2305346.1 hypothetical protein IWW54_005108 [Coemansia sp. RSA 2705]KAJ2326355.1 hypothetical protein IWW51_002315 [Coemansia sp. RSA 2702]
MKRAAYHQPAILPYKPEDGISPFLSAQSLDFLYNMRQVELLNSVNRLTVDTEHDGKTLYDTIYDSARDSTQSALTNNASQAWNIDFFLQSLTSDAKPVHKSLERKLGETFGGLDRFKELFTNNALSMFGNGWTWLVKNESGNLAVMNTYSATCPFTAVPTKDSDVVKGVTYSKLQRGLGQRYYARLFPVLGISMWQEAFLPDYGLDRTQYVENFWKVVNWELVDERIMTSGGRFR